MPRLGVPLSHLSSTKRDVQKVLNHLGIKIVPPNKAGAITEPRQTHSTDPILNIAESYGIETLILTLKIITQTRDGNPGELRNDTMRAIACVVANDERVRECGQTTLEAFENIDLKAMRLRSKQLTKSLDPRVRVNTVMAGMISGALYAQWNFQKSQNG
jgi:hypothetical protein